VLDRREELLKAGLVVEDRFVFESLDSAFHYLLLKIPRDFRSAHAYVGKSKENASRQFHSPEPVAFAI
jgi:hypothetical protein